MGRKIGKLVVVLSLAGFLGVSGLLLTSHWGLAVKITNYLYFILLTGVIYEIIFFKK